MVCGGVVVRGLMGMCSRVRQGGGWAGRRGVLPAGVGVGEDVGESMRLLPRGDVVLCSGNADSSGMSQYDIGTWDVQPVLTEYCIYVCCTIYAYRTRRRHCGSV